MKLSRRQIGMQSKRKGQKFEAVLFHAAFRCNMEIIRIPDSCRSLGLNKIVRAKSPFDFVLLAHGGRCIFIDAKCTSAKSFNLSRIVSHQADALHKAYMRGNLSGYIVDFTTLDQVVFFNSELFENDGKRGSLKPEDGVLLGTEADFKLNLLLRIPICTPPACSIE